MLATLTLDHYVPHIGTEFRCHAGDGNTYPLKLTEATGLGSPGGKTGGSTASPPRRQPFSLIFLGPPQPVLPQAMYPLEHPAMETEAIFIVPVGRDEEGVQYQAIFS
jgi:hypothetical protein